MHAHYQVTVRVFAITIAATCASLVDASIVSVDLYVRSGALNTVDGRTLTALCYTLESSGRAELPAPAMSLIAGDELLLTVHNQHDASVGFEVVGISGSDAVVEPGETTTLSLTFPNSGTWLYRDPVNYPLHQGLGLTGAIEVIDPAADYDNEFLWLLGDHSETWMSTYAASDPVDTSVYRPNYFTVNGRAGTDTNGDPRAHITGRVGDDLLIRVVNGGLRLHTLHFHGYHVEVVARDGSPIPLPREKDTVPIPVGGTAELLLRPHQPGVFPIHDHVVLSVAGNGVYPLGMIVFTDIQE